MLIRKLGQALSGGHEEIVLEPADIETMATREPPPLPRGFAAIATIAAPSEQALNRGRFLVALRSLAGPSGARLLGRFCHADERLRRLVEEHLRAEEALDEDAVFAEIVHLPEGRLGNILLRPVLRGHEIAYLGRSGAPRERQIPIVDLMISVSGGEIRLRSRSLGRRVIPRLTSAHNYDAGSLGAYPLPVRASGPGRGGGPPGTGGRCRAPRSCLVSWPESWCSPVPAGPRTRTSWRGSAGATRSRGSVRDVATDPADPALGQSRRRGQRAAGGPRRAPAAESFVHLAKDRDAATLKELFPGPEELCAHGPEGRFVHEIIVPFVSTGEQMSRPTRTAPVPSRASAGAAVERSFTPGSAWLFVKLYTGTGGRPIRCCVSFVGPVVREAMQSRAVDRWFFIRYGDPDHHLRLRLHGAPTELWRTVWPQLQAAIARSSTTVASGASRWTPTSARSSGMAGRMTSVSPRPCSTRTARRYSRSWARHRTLTMRGSISDCGSTLRGMDQLLGDLAFDVEAKLAILESARRTFAAEFRVDGPFKGQIGERFRQEQPALIQLLDRSHDAASPLAPGFEVLASRSDALRPVAAELLARDRARRLSPPLRDVAAMTTALHANRLLRSAPREHSSLSRSLEFLTRLLAADAHRRRGPAGPGRE